MRQRNPIVDIIRGFAMLLVVLGHTMSGTVSEYSESLLFQIIWTLQMPLFIIISGYVTHYLFLRLVPALGLPALSSMEGLLSLGLNFALTLLLTVVTIKLAQSNKVMYYLLYAKQEQKHS